MPKDGNAIKRTRCTRDTNPSLSNGVDDRAATTCGLYGFCSHLTYLPPSLVENISRGISSVAYAKRENVRDL